MQNHWPLLTRHEFVDIIAPSGKASASDIEAIRVYLIQEGFKPRIPENILGVHPFSANKDGIRFEHLKNALQAEDSTLIWCVRGGSGVTSLMPELMKLKKPSKQKLLVGFSDICSLHLWLNQTWHWPSLHGPMARMTALGKIDSRDVETLHQLWFEGLKNYSINDLQPLNAAAKNLKTLEGITSGGCISVLQTSLGTPWQIDGKDKILFFEDINEQAYRIHRTLVHLTNARVLDHAKAIVLGDFGEITSEKNQFQEGLEDFINHYLPARSLHLPVFRLEGFGHGERNKPLPLGVKAKLTADKIIF